MGTASGARYRPRASSAGNRRIGGSSHRGRGDSPPWRRRTVGPPRGPAARSRYG